MALDEPMTVAKWSHPVPLADGTCHCGRAIKYNLARLMSPIVVHVAPAPDCPEPWPNEPAPEEYELGRKMAALLADTSTALDRALGIKPGGVK